MDPFTEKQIKIDLRKNIIIRSYPTLWNRMLTEWSTPLDVDRGWLLYSANYLFHTAGIRWTIDPVRCTQRSSVAQDVDVSPLSTLDYILLTHRHSDHLDLELLKSLQNFPITWIVPEFLLDHLRTFGLQPQILLRPDPRAPIILAGMILTPFEGFHWEGGGTHEKGRRGVPSMGYKVEFNGKSWLFPGDTRTYHPGALTQFGPVDVLFAHLWLGRGCALQEAPELLEAFCLFCLSSQPRRIIVTHLEEIGRKPEDYWDDRHFVLVEDWFRMHAPEIEVEPAYTGDHLVL